MQLCSKETPTHVLSVSIVKVLKMPILKNIIDIIIWNTFEKLWKRFCFDYLPALVCNMLISAIVDWLVSMMKTLVEVNSPLSSGRRT